MYFYGWNLAVIIKSLNSACIFQASILIFHPENEQEIFVPGGEFRLWKSVDGIWDLDFS
jgi:hypothetical protein